MEECLKIFRLKEALHSVAGKGRRLFLDLLIDCGSNFWFFDSVSYPQSICLSLLRWGWLSQAIMRTLRVASILTGWVSAVQMSTTVPFPVVVVALLGSESCEQLWSCQIGASSFFLAVNNRHPLLVFISGFVAAVGAVIWKRSWRNCLLGLHP